ncbi:PREDICTED: uncharacterized protein LOC105950060 [Erythranthe guttata]|nr:PREDICTED: uncharacterized protein LOC105950060 [Erythranthe guttata]|eukprot:XP_012828835.1 PREDICTED: uncharacterized protein LOC105950060 [Erythranthe guttata]
MAHMIIKPLVFLSIVLSINIVQIIVGADPFTKRFEVNVYDFLPKENSKLITHCQSKDDDFGNHTLYLNQYQQWAFHQDVFKRTLYFCHLWWNGKQQTFDVFSKHLSGDCQTGIGGNICSWIAKADGIYFSPDRVTSAGPIGVPQKRYDWQ